MTTPSTDQVSVLREALERIFQESRMDNENGRHLHNIASKALADTDAATERSAIQPAEAVIAGYGLQNKETGAFGSWLYPTEQRAMLAKQGETNYSGPHPLYTAPVAIQPAGDAVRDAALEEAAQIFDCPVAADLRNSDVAAIIRERKSPAAPAASSSAAPSDDFEAKSHKQMSEAWLAVFGVLQEVCPDWLNIEGTGMTKAVTAIRRLAAPTGASQSGLTDADIRRIATAAYKAGELSWLGFEACPETEKYSIPVLSVCHYQLAHAIGRHLAGATPTKGAL